MATQTISYGTKTALTITLASLATSATHVAGQESSEVDNSSTKAVDYFVQGKVTVGTTPTANTQILVYVWGGDESAATEAVDVIDGTDSAETFTAGARNSVLKLAAVLDVDATTSDKAYYFSFALAQLFGGVCPKFWGVWVTHNTGVNLNATGGNHEINHTAIKYDVA